MTTSCAGSGAAIAVFQVMADGLPSAFPVLRSVDHFAGNLPRHVSSLIGRDAEVDSVAERVRSQRLVTLTGVGGVGKTRLAIEVGAELAGEFDDGVWIVELAGVGDPGAVPAALATVLGITPQSDLPLIDTVANTVAGRRLLLIVDNCEHLRGSAAAAIEAILRSTRTREGPGDLARGPGRGRRVGHDRVSAGDRRRRELRCRHPVRGTGPLGSPRLPAPGPADRCGGDARSARRLTGYRSASNLRRPAWLR